MQCLFHKQLSIYKDNLYEGNMSDEWDKLTILSCAVHALTLYNLIACIILKNTDIYLRYGNLSNFQQT